MRTQVCIVGGGPSGLLLSQLLAVAGIQSIVLEKHTRDHVLRRVEADVLEADAVELLHRAEVGDRIACHAQPHSGFWLTWNGGELRIDLENLTGKNVMLYGQTEVTRDLYAARDKLGGVTIHEAMDISITDLHARAPLVSYTRFGKHHEITCDFVAGCDGGGGISRQSIPAEAISIYEKEYPFSWLGVLSQTPPLMDELVYSGADADFALCSMRNPQLSRYYIQCGADEDPANWTDSAFWDALKARLPPHLSQQLVTGPSIEKSVSRLRSSIVEPMRWGQLFLVGDAAHIVPLTATKGLNLAFSDVHYLSNAFIGWYYTGEETGLLKYSERALARVWKAERFSWWMTSVTHRFPEQSLYDRRMQDAELAWLAQSEAAQTALAQNYVGLPF